MKTPKYYYFKANSIAHSMAIQARLFEMGFTWGGGKKRHQTSPSMEVGVEGTLGHRRLGCTLSSGWYADHEGLELTLNDLYSPNCALLKPLFKKVKLNDTHTAEVYKDKIVVGCQEFPVYIVAQLEAALVSLNS